MMAIGVFCDDRAMFGRAVDCNYDGSGDGRLTHYINDEGQCREMAVTSSTPSWALSIWPKPVRSAGTKVWTCTARRA